MEEQESVNVPVAEEQNTGDNTQVAAEKVTSDVEINWRAANEALRSQSQELKQLRVELDQYRSSQDAPKKKGYFDGRDKDDIPTFGEVENVLAERERTYQASLQELNIRSSYPDYNDVVNKYGKMLPESVKRGIINSPNPYLAAYEACKDSSSYYKDQIANIQHPDAKRVTDNMQKPGNASAIGNSGTLGKASYYENLSENVILEMSNRFIRGR